MKPGRATLKEEIPEEDNSAVETEETGRKCTKQFVVLAVRGARFHLSQLATSRYIAANAFSKQGGGNAGRSERRDYSRPRFQDKKMFEATCDKCGKRFELPFKPTGEKPVYCNDCFDRGNNAGSKTSVSSNSNQYKEQFEMLNAKLDRIIKVLIPAAPSKEEKKEAPKVIVVEKKEVIIKKKESSP